MILGGGCNRHGVGSKSVGCLALVDARDSTRYGSVYIGRHKSHRLGHEVTTIYSVTFG